MPKQDYFPELLDRVCAILDCGAGTQVELARFVLPHTDSENAAQITVSRWIRGKRKPNAENALRISEWATAKTMEIKAAGEQAQDELFLAAFARTEAGKAAMRAAAAAWKKEGNE